MSPSKIQQTTKGNKHTVRFPSRENTTLKDASLSAVDGYNLAEFSLSPLSQRTDHLAKQTIKHQWTQILEEGKKRECFFKKQYGNIAPNSGTEDILLILTHLARQSDNPLRVNTSIYEILQIKGTKHNPNKQQIDQVIRHLDALYGMSLETNFAYDPDEEEWHSVKTRVLGGYSYKDEDGEERTRQVRIQKNGGDDEYVEVIKEQTVKELKEVNFTSLFYRHFVKNSIPIDLGVYFALGVPTAKRIYRFGNKYIQLFGQHSLDLQLFCISRIGMSRTYTEKYRPSTLASKIRPYAQRVSETETMSVEVEKSKTTPSGYKITFSESVIQQSLPTLERSFTNAEDRAFSLLKDNGIYPNIARSIVIKCRRALGSTAPEYIKFVIQRFTQDYVKSGKLNVPKKKAPGVLKSFFDNDWYYPHFVEYQAEQQKKERREEASRYPDQSLDFSSIASDVPGMSGIVSTNDNASFSQDQFADQYPEVYQRIVEKVRKRYQSDTTQGLDISKDKLDEMRDRAITLYCKQCRGEFQKGNDDFFPPSLIDELDNSS